jgi:hypothetical protein
VSPLIHIDHNDDKIDRRDLLKSATAVLTGLVVAGSPLAAIAKGPAWAIDMFTLNTVQVTNLFAITRSICPHDKLEDLAYAVVVKSIDADAAKDEHTHALITDGLAQLDQRSAIFPEGMRFIALKKIETTPFFQYLRLKTVQNLYTTPMAYAHFGYEGEAFSKGGYIYRGFDDLHWLSEVPAEDSGTVPGKPDTPANSTPQEKPQEKQGPANP